MTRATALIAILRMWITRAISRAMQRLLIRRATAFYIFYILHRDFTYYDNASHYSTSHSASQREPTLTCNVSHRISKDFTYFENASHSASQRLLITRAILQATALPTILRMWIMRATAC